MRLTNTLASGPDDGEPRRGLRARRKLSPAGPDGPGIGLNGGMQITSRLDFAADPAQTYLMMSDRRWLEEMVTHSKATEHQIDIAGNTIRITMELPAPDQLGKFAGSSLTMLQTVTWDEPAADGSRNGTLVIEAKGLPVDCSGRAFMHPGGKGTLVEYDGNLKVNIPFVGGQIEKLAAPYVTEAINAQQIVGDQWLAAKGSQA